MRVVSWVRGRSWRARAGVVVAAAVAGALAVVALTGDDAQQVTAGVDSPSTTADRDTTTTATEPTTTTTVPPTTTTTVAPTTTAPPPTAPPTTAPPPTAPPTTVPAAPTEFRATVRGVDEGPAYYGILYGTTFGASGGFNVYAACRPGTATVTVLDDGMVDPLPPGQNPVKLILSVDDTTTLAEFVVARDGQVFSGPVTGRVRIQVLYPSNHDVRIKYDCRG